MLAKLSVTQSVMKERSRKAIITIQEKDNAGSEKGGHSADVTRY